MIRKSIPLTTLMLILFIPVLAGAWYYNISIDTTKNFFFNGVKVNLNYTFYEFGRIKRGLLVFEIENSTNTTVRISSPQFNDEKFYLSPNRIFKEPLKLHPGQKLVFYTFFQPSEGNLKLKISEKDFVLPMGWTLKLYEEKKWSWFTMRVGRISSFFFWVSVILYISNRVKNM